MDCETNLKLKQAPSSPVCAWFHYYLVKSFLEDETNFENHDVSNINISIQVFVCEENLCENLLILL